MAFLNLTDLRKQFGASVAVESFNLAVEPGEFVSFLGPSGCGKTTTLRMIAGFETPTGGMIKIEGEDVTRRPANRRNVGMVFQSYALFPNMTVAQNIGFGLKVARQPATEIKARVQDMLRLIRMPDFANRYPYQMSGGQQQRVALARALALQPKVLLLDEPLSALDAKIRLSLRQEIKTIQRQLGITTIYVTHDQEEALSLSDRIVVMSEGRSEQIGSPYEIYNFPQTPFVASFVGTLNVLPAQVVNATDQLLEVEGQPVRVARPLVSVPATGTVSLALRPEALNRNVGATDVNQLQGVVEETLFLGAVMRVRVRVGRHVIAVDEFSRPDNAPPQPGTPTRISFPAEAALVLGPAHQAAPVVELA